MNVAYVSNVVYPFVNGGAQKRVHEIGTRLADRGHEVTVYCRHYWDGPREMTFDGLTLRSVSPARDLYTSDDGRRSISEALEFAAALVVPLRRHIAEHDLVVASVFPYFPVLASTAGTLFADTPLLTTWHEVWGDYWNGYLGRLAPFGKVVERVTATVPQHPVAVSQTTANRLARIGPARDAITVVPNGIDIDAITATPPAADGFDVLFVGRLIREKNVDMLLQAFDRIATEHDATLGIIGDGPELDRLRSLTERSSVADRVTFLGFLDTYEDVLGHMHAADVFVSPSTREGFGITFAEAMAANCTVIGADHPESAGTEVIGDGGFLVEAAVSPLAEMLGRALDGERPATDPVAVARQYNWDAIARRAETLYQRVVTDGVPHAASPNGSISY